MKVKNWGADGGRLFNWLDDRMATGPNGQVFRELMATGAVIAGRRTFELADRWQGDHHDGVPVHVLTHHAGDGDVPPGKTRYLTDVVACATEARTAAGDRAVMVHGAGAAQALLQAGQLDELEIHPGSCSPGRRPQTVRDRNSNPIELELVRRLEDRDVTHLRYRVLRSA